MVIVLIHYRRQIDHISHTCVCHLAFATAHLVVSNRVDECLQLSLVWCIMDIQLLMDFSQDGILMMRVSEDRSLIFVQFRFQSTDEIEIRKMSRNSIDKLSCMSDCIGSILIPIYSMM